MSDTVVQVWPKDAPTSLWNYDLLTAERRASLPFLGIHPDWSFFFAFLFGASVVAAFAWQRFKQRSFEPSELDYEVVKKLSPLQLRDGRAMRHAYAYYAGVMISIYASLTFFGGIILKAVNYIPMAGIQADVDQNTMTSPTWPLYLALGMAGFAPMLKPVEVVETWLRRRVHAWAGVPVQLKDRTRRFLLALDRRIQPLVDRATLDPATRGGVAAKGNGVVMKGLVDEKVKKIPPWMKPLLERMGSYGPLIRKWVELDLMIEAIRDPGSWPETHVLEELQPLVREQRISAEKAVLALDDLSKMDDPGTQPDQQSTKDGKFDSDKHARRRRQVEVVLLDTLAKIERSRLELAAILTVYAERSPYLDSKFENTERGGRHVLEHTLRSAVDELCAHRREPDTVFWLSALLVPTFLLYAVMTFLGLHSLLGSVQTTAVAMFTTAALETLQVGFLFWLPAVAVLALRQYFADSDQLYERVVPIHYRETAERTIYCIGLGGLLAIVGLALLATLWMALVAENTERFIDLLVGRSMSATLVMLPKAVCTCVFIFFLVRALDRPASAKSGAIGYAALSTLVVTSVLLTLSLGWETRCFTQESCDALKTLSENYAAASRKGFLAIYRHYNVTDFLLCFAVIFITIANAAWPEAKLDVPGQVGGDAPMKAQSIAVANVLGALATSLFLVLAINSAALAQQKNAETPAEKRTLIRVGFREDAEPFSYLAGPSSARRYRGYVADLCYSIFANSPFRIEEVKVTAENRFDSFRKNLDGRLPGPKVDILCDPTTLRFWRDDGEIEGFFSPIVFVTGVSYLVRRNNGPQSGVDLAYVSGATAKAIASRACEADLFRAPTGGGSDCKIPAANCTEASEMPMRLCQFDNHDAAIAWFCHSSNRQLVYFGDREIIQAKLDSWVRAKGCNQRDVERQASFYTYEPYALLVSLEKKDLARFVQSSVYDFFSHRSKAIGLFTSYFPDVQMSPMMANLFLLNAVDEPVYNTVPSYLFDNRSSR